MNDEELRMRMYQVFRQMAKQLGEGREIGREKMHRMHKSKKGACLEREVIYEGHGRKLIHRAHRHKGKGLVGDGLVGDGLVGDGRKHRKHRVKHVSVVTSPLDNRRKGRGISGGKHKKVSN